ncbi:phosphoribosylglycinamide formyltransferase [Christiangramia aquimixticola]|uniref:phosphoribosylglycinamide formyltransferase n=1 Tax=Christiangramia aquimixticola TaxID=1697558 RepID=UPI003AA838B1
MSDKLKKPRQKIVIFASGSGTNAENIIKYFRNSEEIEVAAVFSNKKFSGALERAHNLKVQALHFDRKAFYDTHEVLNILKDMKPDLIVLAGFLWLIPSTFIKTFPNKIINIHPALLPRFGGKDMYGSRVHEAVIESKEKESGITIHYVNEKYDEGNTIFQTSIPIEDGESAQNLASRIHKLEYKHFPEIIQQTLQQQDK